MAVVRGMFGYSNVTFTLKDVRDPAPPDVFTSAGNRNVGARFLAQNFGTRTVERYPSMKLFTNTGQGFDRGWVSNELSPELPHRLTLKPDGQVEGWVLFEIPEGQQALTVEIDDVQWELRK